MNRHSCLWAGARRRNIIQYILGKSSRPDSGVCITECCRWVVICNEPGETGSQSTAWYRLREAMGKVKQVNPRGSGRWVSWGENEGCFLSPVSTTNYHLKYMYLIPFGIHVSNSIKDQSLSMNLFSIFLCDVSFY